MSVKQLYLHDGRSKLLALLLLIAMMMLSQHINAEALTYSPDQWPQRWNKLMNKTALQQRLNGFRVAERRYGNSAPLQSPVWGVVPEQRKRPRRTVRPEYDTRSHIKNYYSPMVPSTGLLPAYPGYGMVPPLVGTTLPYGVPLVAPGLAAPAIPAYPLYGGYGVLPVPGYIW